ncbi:Crp/Fnr family transcriptional regulator [Chryseobacterium sp. C39-AII1]|uniref:Crp/Fnr family transcriptional regulator n=1 Tax=Chryseobacterium sp. C39-AII1 TaxID=3080332 RepID=UPI00320A07C5
MADVFENFLFSKGLPAEEIDFSMQFFQQISLKKGDFFIQEDKHCFHVGFIASGAVKAYALDKDGKENITCFKFENEFASSFPEFVKQEKSKRSIKAIEDCVIYSINHSDYQLLLSKMPAWNVIIKSIMEWEYTQKELYLLNYNNKSTLDKYLHILSHEPMLIQRITTQDLASYLGVAQRSLTRIKSQIHKPKVL